MSSVRYSEHRVYFLCNSLNLPFQLDKPTEGEVRITVTLDGIDDVNVSSSLPSSFKETTESRSIGQ